MSKKVPSPRKARDGASTGETRGASSPRGEERGTAARSPAASRIGKSGAGGTGAKARASAEARAKGGGDARKAKSTASTGAGASPARGPSKSPQPTVRLQKVLAEAGVASRRRAEELILAGKVKVNGMVVRELGTKVDPTRDRVVVAGEIARSEPKVYYLLNKPDGIVCSAEGQTDDRGRPTVLSLLQGVHERIYPVGRLDFHTRGLLLLTNDGELADLLAHPRNKVLKVYHAKFQGRLDHAALDALAKGVVLDDGVKTKPAEISVIKDTDTNTWVEIGLRQGLNRQVRRMGEAIGHPVLKLIRVGLGDLDVDDLDEGQYRRLSRTEIETLRAYAQFGKEGAKEGAKPGANEGDGAGTKPAASPRRSATDAAAKRSSAGTRPERGSSPRPSPTGEARGADRPRAAQDQPRGKTRDQSRGPKPPAEGSRASSGRSARTDHAPDSGSRSAPRSGPRPDPRPDRRPASSGAAPSRSKAPGRGPRSEEDGARPANRTSSRPATRAAEPTAGRTGHDRPAASRGKRLRER